MPETDGDGRLLFTAEVAALFHVAPETVRRWALSGRLPGARTPGGQRRFAESAVLALLAEQTTEGAS